MEGERQRLREKERGRETETERERERDTDTDRELRGLFCWPERKSVSVVWRLVSCFLAAYFWPPIVNSQEGGYLVHVNVCL